MPVELYWDPDEKNTTRIDFTGVVSMAELFDVWMREAEMQREISEPVYSLNNFYTIQPTIRNINVKQLVAFVQGNMPPNLQMTVQVADMSFLRRVLATLSMTMGHSVYVVSSMDEARSIIRAHQRAYDEQQRAG